ncbi:MAG TPA: small ribosomal subunit Rsm22 family protein, partial [Herpetosiphonaceae bacterium]
LVEPGTPRGFELIRAARERLLAAGAAMVAPCPHAAACPLGPGDWCHFSQRIGRTKLQRAVKQADLGFEDEKFSYLAVSRHPAAPIAARVLRHPRVEPGKISLELCAADGLRAEQIGKRHPGWRQARDLRWGDAIEPGDGEPGG